MVINTLTVRLDTARRPTYTKTYLFQFILRHDGSYAIDVVTCLSFCVVLSVCLSVCEQERFQGGRGPPPVKFLTPCAPPPKKVQDKAVTCQNFLLKL